MGEKLQAQEAFFEMQEVLLKLSGEVKYIHYKCKYHPDLSLLEIDPGIHELIGIRSEKLLEDAHQFSKKMPSFDKGVIWDQIFASRSNTFTLIHRLTHENGNEIWVWNTGNIVYEGKKPIYVKGKIADVTQRKFEVDELLKQKRFFESTLNTMPVELVVLNTDQRYIFCNETAIKNAEIRKWIIGKNDYEYCAYRGRDYSIAEERVEKFNQALYSKEEVEWEEELADAKGEMVYSIKRYSPIVDEEGEVKMIIGYGFNVTDRKVAEQKVKENEKLMASINANLQDGIYRFNNNKGLVYMNQAFVDMFGYEKDEDIQNDPGFFSDDPNRQQLISDIEDSGSFKNREILLRKKDGTLFWALVSCLHFKDNDQVYYDGVIVNITELKTTEELLRQKNIELYKTNNELDRFVYSASHDLRAPLTSILGVLTVAELEIKDELSMKYLEMIKSRVNKLDNFIIDIINYFRNARLDEQKDEINLRQMLIDIFDNMNYLPGANKIKLKFSVEEKVVFFSDKNRLVVILNNIISNAIKYHNFGQKKPEIKVSIRVNEKEAVVKIADNGKGINNVYLEKIYDMFFRASYDSIGSGLGLYIVKETITRLNGNITAKSELGKGTEFTITIPNRLDKNVKLSDTRVLNNIEASVSNQ